MRSKSIGDKKNCREKVLLSRKVVLKAENSTFKNNHQKVK